MTEIISGGCACGAVRYEYTGKPVVSYKCHCSNCQRISGSGYLPILWVPARVFTLIKGELRYYFGEASSGRKVGIGFCPECGSPVLGKLELPGIVPIIASSLDEPDNYQATMQIWTASARQWDRLDPELKNYDTQFSHEEVMEWLGAMRAEMRQR